LETTGADPLPILLTFSTELRDLTRLDSILTLVDVETFTLDHFESDALSQLVYGDIILLNKTDLVAAEQIDGELHSHREAGARIIRSQHGQVPLPLILDVGYNDPKAYTKMLETQDAHHQHNHSEHEHHTMNTSITTITTRNT